MESEWKGSIRKYWIIGILFIGIVGTLSHFVFEWTGNHPLAGLFSPVSESIWEHIKLLFFPMLLYTFFLKAVWKSSQPCILYAMLAGNLLGCVIIPILYYSYSGILGFQITAIDIGIFYFSILIAFTTAYRLALSGKAVLWRYRLILITGILAVLFWVFTCQPPNLGLFLAP